MWGKLLVRSFPHTPFKNFLTKKAKENFYRHQQTAEALINSRQAIASCQGPPTLPTPKVENKKRKGSPEVTFLFFHIFDDIAYVALQNLADAI